MIDPFNKKIYQERMSHRELKELLIKDFVEDGILEGFTFMDNIIYDVPRMFFIPYDHERQIFYNYKLGPDCKIDGNIFSFFSSDKIAL